LGGGGGMSVGLRVARCEGEGRPGRLRCCASDYNTHPRGIHSTSATLTHGPASAAA
jgi:hypothetical protein